MFEKDMPSNKFKIYNILDGFKEWKIRTFLKLSETMD
jgi:hypothetical protein